MYEMQVWMPKDGNGRSEEYAWVSIRPSNSEAPYRFETEAEARRMLYICYGPPMVPREHQRVVEVVP